MCDYVGYYSIEQYLFNVVRKRFHDEHSIGAFDFFSIIVWKANRVKSHVARRMLSKGATNLDEAARSLTSALFRATSEQHRMSILLDDWGFRLPMASGILTVFWPEDFTIYDTRVCNELAGFHTLVNRGGQKAWEGYCQFRKAVRDATPSDLSLRDKDRYLFGRSAVKQLQTELETRLNFELPSGS